YNVTEVISPSLETMWSLTAINCSVNGTSGSFTVNFLNDTTVQIDLKKDDIVTCEFVNETENPTRTQGFYRTHTDITNATFEGPREDAAVVGFTNRTIIIGTSDTGIVVDNIKEVFGLYYARNHFNEDGSPSNSDDTPRSPENQAFTIMAHQLLTAKLNCGVFGCTASAISLIQQCDEAFANGDSSMYGSCNAALDTYNNSGDSGAFDFEAAFGIGPGATPKASKDLANDLLEGGDPHAVNTGISRWDESEVDPTSPAT
ncbi:MAG: hypothetical protein PVG77_07620, partial [Nitrosopumilaceae archaeon]